jgi:stage III sporulation protein AH
MKKPTMIIGKKQIILAGMTLILGLAVYINYAVSTSDGKIKATDVVKSQSVNYGDAQLVSTDSTSSTRPILILPKFSCLNQS